MPKNAHITLVTTCKGRLRYLKDSLPTWLDLDYDTYDIVVVDFDCPDQTYEWIESRRQGWLKRGRAADVRCIRVPDKPYFNLNEARNVGIRATAADLVFVIDADTHVQKKSVLRAINRGYQSGVVFFSHYQVLNSNFVEAQTFFLKRFGLGVGSPALLPVGALVSGLSGTACFSRGIAEACGLYKPEINETGFGYDEWDFYIRFLNYHFYQNLYKPAGPPLLAQLDDALGCATAWEPGVLTNVDNREEERHRFYRCNIRESSAHNKDFVRAIFRNFPGGIGLDRGPNPGGDLRPWEQPLAADEAGFQTVAEKGIPTASWFGFWFNNWRGLTLIDGQDFAGAEPSLRRALSDRRIARHFKAPTYLGLGRVYESMGRPEWRAYYRKGLSSLEGMNGTTALQCYNFASLCQRLGEYGQAEKLFKRLLAEDFFRGGVLFHLGQIACLRKDFRAARAYLRRCVKHVPDHRKALEQLRQIDLQRVVPPKLRRAREREGAAYERCETS